jgi:hypothetical protein
VSLEYLFRIREADRLFGAGRADLQASLFGGQAARGGAPMGGSRVKIEKKPKSEGKKGKKKGKGGKRSVVMDHQPGDDRE